MDEDRWYTRIVGRRGWNDAFETVRKAGIVPTAGCGVLGGLVGGLVFDVPLTEVILSAVGGTGAYWGAALVYQTVRAPARLYREALAKAQPFVSPEDAERASARQKREHLAQLLQAGKAISRGRVATAGEANLQRQQCQDWINTTAAWIEANYGIAEREIFLDTANVQAADLLLGHGIVHNNFMLHYERILANLVQLLDRLR